VNQREAAGHQPAHREVGAERAVLLPALHQLGDGGVRDRVGAGHRRGRQHRRRRVGHVRVPAELLPSGGEQPIKRLVRRPLRWPGRRQRAGGVPDGAPHDRLEQRL
jgi:hypothetical protein